MDLKSVSCRFYRFGKYILWGNMMKLYVIEFFFFLSFIEEIVQIEHGRMEICY